MSFFNALKSLTFPKGTVAAQYDPPEFRVGWLQDPPGVEDPPFERVLPTLERGTADGYDVDLRPWCSEIESQSTLGSCVANATIGAIEMRRIFNGELHVDLSRLFAYYNSRIGHSATSRDDGTHVRMCCTAIAKMGVCRESSWQYDTTMVYKRPSWNCYREAYAYKIAQCSKIDATGDRLIELIIAALRVNHPVIFGVQVWQSFRSCTGAVVTPTVGETKLGGHAMLIVGVNVAMKTFIVRNSWGKAWGDLGYCYMPFSYLKTGDAHDFWVCTL